MYESKNVIASMLRIGDWVVKSGVARQILEIDRFDERIKGSRIRFGFHDDKYLYVNHDESLQAFYDTDTV